MTHSPNDRSSQSRFERAQAGYDQGHESELVARLTETIFTASKIDKVCVLRLGELSEALTLLLALTLALSPAVTRTPRAIRERVEQVGKRLRQQVAAAEHSPDLFEFKRRTFNDEDKGGHA